MLKLKNSKKTLSVAVLTALIACAGTNVQPRSAHAVIGIATLDPLVVLAGLAGTGGMVTFLALCVPHDGDDLSTAGEACTAFAFPAGIGGAMGLVMLPENGTDSIRFSTMSPSKAAWLGVSEDDRQAFNSELSEINAVLESVQSSVSGEKRVTAERVRQRWLELSADLDAGAVRAVEKISEHAVKPARK